MHPPPLHIRMDRWGNGTISHSLLLLMDPLTPSKRVTNLVREMNQLHKEGVDVLAVIQEMEEDLQMLKTLVDAGFLKSNY